MHGCNQPLNTKGFLIVVASGKFAVMVVCGSIVTAMIWIIRDPPEKVTLGAVLLGIVLGLVGLFFLNLGMEALDQGWGSCGSRRHHSICTSNDFEFWMRILMHYAASVVCLSVPLMFIGTPLLARPAAPAARKRSSR